MTRLGPIISAGVAIVRLYYANNDTNMMNTFHVKSPGGGAWSASDLEGLESAFETWFTTLAAPQVSNAVALERVSCTDLTTETARSFDKQLSPPAGGGNIGAVLPANVTIAVKGNIEQRGRGRSARVYWVGLTQSQIDDDSLDPTAADAIVGALDGLQALIESSVPGAVLGVIHTIIGGIRPSDCPFSQIFNWVMSDFLLDSQKDRLPGHKKHKA